MLGAETLGAKETQHASAMRVVVLSSHVLVRETEVGPAASVALDQQFDVKTTQNNLKGTQKMTSKGANVAKTIAKFYLAAALPTSTLVQIVLGAPEMCAGTVCGTLASRR